jgi:hypothetical protein
MKFNDILGLSAVFAAGWYTANQSQAATVGAVGWQWYDFLIIAVLLMIGFYFAVVLS